MSSKVEIQTFGVVAKLYRSRSILAVIQQSGKAANSCDMAKLAALVPNHRLYDSNGVFTGTSNQPVEGAPKRNQLWNAVCDRYRAQPAFLVLILKRIFDLDLLLTDGVYEVLVPSK